MYTLLYHMLRSKPLSELGCLVYSILPPANFAAM